MAKTRCQCFCHYSAQELKNWIVKKYQLNLSTVELLKSARSKKDKEEIGVVALLDVDDNSVLTALQSVNTSEHRVLHCRNEILKSFREMPL